MYPRKIKNYVGFLDGTSYMGRTVEGKLPELKLKTSEYRGGGMDGSLDVPMGQEKMEAEVTFAEWNPEVFRAWGNRKALVLRPGAQGENDFSADSFIFTMRGRFPGLSPDALKPTDDSNLKLMMAVDYLKIERNGEELIEIDVENMVRIVDGVDQLAELRSAMGV